MYYYRNSKRKVEVVDEILKTKNLWKAKASIENFKKNKKAKASIKNLKGKTKKQKLVLKT